MKKTAIVGAIIAVIGVILFSIGLGRNGLKSIYWDNGFKINHTVTKTVSFKKVTDIDINAATTGPIMIERGDTPEVKIKTSKSRPVTTSVSDGKLNVTAKQHSGFQLHGFSFEYDDYSHSNVTIMIPKNMKLNTVTTAGDSTVIVKDVSVKTIVNNGDNDINLSNMSLADMLTIQNSPSGVDGDVTLNNVAAKGLTLSAYDDVTIANSRFNAQDSTVQSQDGDITFHQNDWRNVSASSSDGDINFNQQKIHQTFKATTTDGDIMGVVSPDKGVSIQTHVSDGDSTIFGFSRNSYGSTTGNQIYDLSSTDGDVGITR